MGIELNTSSLFSDPELEQEISEELSPRKANNPFLGTLEKSILEIDQRCFQDLNQLANRRPASLLGRLTKKASPDPQVKAAVKERLLQCSQEKATLLLPQIQKAVKEGTCQEFFQSFSVLTKKNQGYVFQVFFAEVVKLLKENHLDERKAYEALQSVKNPFHQDKLQKALLKQAAKLLYNPNQGTRHEAALHFLAHFPDPEIVLTSIANQLSTGTLTERKERVARLLALRMIQQERFDLIDPYLGHISEGAEKALLLERYAEATWQTTL